MPETLVPTPDGRRLPRRFADFATFGEALDYAAQGVRGLNFHDPRGTLMRAYPFAELRHDAIAIAHRLIAARRQAGRPDRAGRRDRPRIRRAVLRRDLCRRLAGAAAAADQLRRQAKLYRPARGRSSKAPTPSMLLYPAELADMAGAAAEAAACKGLDWETSPRRRARRRRRCPTAEPGRHRLSAIFERLDPLPARRRHHPSRAAQQPRRARPSA